MPRNVVSEVQNKMRQFVTCMSIGHVSVWTHCTHVMKSKVALVDIRLQNIAMLLCTAHRFARDVEVRSFSHSRWMQRCSCCMGAAREAFVQKTGRPVQAEMAKGMRGIYRALLESEMEDARDYVTHRLNARSLSASEFFENVARIPLAATDHHRSNTLLWVLNGLATTHRVATFRGDVAETACMLCGAASDSLMHLVNCDVVRECIVAVVGEYASRNPDKIGTAHVWPPCAHFFQGRISPVQLLLIMRVDVVI